MTEQRAGKVENDADGRLLDLQKMRNELQAMISQVDRELSQLRGSAAPSKTPEAEDSDDRPKKQLWAQPARAMLLDALDLVGWPAYTRELAHLVEALYGRKIAPTRFGTLAADEMAAYRNKGSDARPVWLCFALTADRHEPIKRLLARSDWPLQQRIHTLTSGRLQYFLMTKRLCELAMKAEEIAVDPQMLRILAADYARDLPGVSVRRGSFDLELWRDVAADQTADLSPRDEILRKESAALLARWPHVYQLFGLPEVIEGDREAPGRERVRA